MTSRSSERYRIHATLGAGGMGVVYRATDTQLERTVALKVLEDAASDGALVREARAASALNHPSICTVYEVGDVNGRPCIVMEHVDGPSLATAIPPDGLPPTVVIRYGIQIADALAHAHERGVIHRDLKSANVMIAGEGRVKVLDFGLARRVREERRDLATTVLTNADDDHELAGTIPYMSPALLQGKPASAADDVWALGVLLYEMASGQLPFQGATRFELATSIQRDAPAPLDARVPPSLTAVIFRCLSRDGTGYRHAREVRAALEILQTATVSVPPRPHQPLANLAVVAGVLIALALAGSIMWWRLTTQPAPSSPVAPAVAIAVLPLANTANDARLEYLTDGIAETVISSLARVPGKLTVAPWTSVQRYRGHTADAKTVGRDLNATAVLSGSVVERSGVLTVAVELINTNDLGRLWGESYDVRGVDLVGVQQDIATRIASALELRLSGEEQRALRSHYPANPEAYDPYLKGQYHLYRFTPDDYYKSRDYFRQAIALDPRYALAYAGFARVLSSMTYEGLLPPPTYLEVVRAAETALSLDSTLGAAHDVLGEVKFAYEWDWAAADREFQRALALSPRDDGIHRFHAIFLRSQRRWEEAIGEMKAALALNPVSAETTKALGATYFWAGQHDKAIEQFTRALTLDPAQAQALDLLADAYAAKGEYAQALEARRRYLMIEGAFDRADALGHDGSADGYQKAMRGLYSRYLVRLEHASKDPKTYVSPMEFAFIHIALGDKDRAFAALERAYSERAPWLSSLDADPAFDPLRSDLRFVSLLKRVGFAPAGS
jgi:serine/threonine-protein kinase